VAGAVLLASFGFLALAYRAPSHGPLCINGSLAVLGLVAIDDSLMVPGDMPAVRSRRSGSAWSITVGCPVVASGVRMRRARLPGGTAVAAVALHYPADVRASHTKFPL
jgi:hypothetical protein